ncbi:CRISP-associated protein Cas1 [Cetobacterium ceti]|uniref:CRISPR-associated endonuclease Cas1 n=1 Tax=Cetobacterium ceti TaxID=180163 RepID=A0A1T4MAA4_9FUSO|nr:type I-B CRISPR-associated endonuclease Cas1b [Cetobacterium ceti]SJZ63970.1 CRISP-associated protein Cas1 [Cetobacterium ceti]
MGESYYLFSNGTLSRKDNLLRLKTEGGTFKDLKIEVTRDVYIFGEMNVNTKCLNYMGQLKIPMHIFNYYGFYTGSFYPKEINVSGKLLVKQVEAYLNESKKMIIAKEFIQGASHNILRNLKYYKNRGRDLEKEILEIEYLKNKIKETKDTKELMGIEGNIRKIYYDSWNKIFNKDVEFEKRVKRPPDNMVNTLISFINTLVYTAVLSEIYKTQLNPTISFLHSPGERRFSLCLDIAEIFKPLIADRMIFSLINKGIVSEKDFDNESNFCYLKENTRKIILKEFDERLKETIKHRTLNKYVSYRYLMRLEAYKIIKFLAEKEEYNSFKIWW